MIKLDIVNLVAERTGVPKQKAEQVVDSLFEAMKEAVANERKLWKTIQEMERISRRIIFASASDTRRRKRLSKKVLGLN